MIVLDTHALVWLDGADPRLGAGCRAAADEALGAGQLAVSAISFWEVAMLAEKGRLTIEQSLLAWRDELIDAGLVEVPVSGGIGIAAAGLDELRGDPADRIIVASCLDIGATLATADERILQWDGPLARLDARK